MVDPCGVFQVGKGRDVGLGQITGFVAKISMGNGMQARSREVSQTAVGGYVVGAMEVRTSDSFDFERAAALFG